MAIDAKVAGVRMVLKEEIVKLNLEGREGNDPPGQDTLRILNTKALMKKPMWLDHLRELIGCGIWGGVGSVMVGNRKIGQRRGCNGVEFVDDWPDVIKAAARNL